MWNCFGHGIVEFVKDWWSVFDAIVVLISLTSLFLHGSNVKSLRLLRVSRLWMKFVTNRVCVSVSMCLSGQSTLLCSSAVLANDLCTRLLLPSVHLPLSISHVLSLTSSFLSSPRILTPSLPHARTHRCTGSQGRAVGGEIQFAQVSRDKIKAVLQSFDFATRMNISVDKHGRLDARLLSSICSSKCIVFFLVTNCTPQCISYFVILYKPGK